MENQQPDLIKMNGFEQLIEMLKVADQDFQETLLRQIRQKDQTLAKKIRESLIHSS